ncbi:MAG TPA: TadE/TadG family type IV pilus assembly protein [Myxococcota bacterium]|nr:TadE/TadG family type IV pilus assembly protein [Myxococcota bacterium]
MVSEIGTSARRQRSEAGTSIIEAAIAMPVMLLVLFGIAEFGVQFTRWNSLTNAVREGARTGVVFRSPCVAGTVTALIEATVADFAESSGIDTASIDTTVTGACAGTGTQLTVTATVPYDSIALAALANLAPTTNLTARTVMRNE